MNFSTQELANFIKLVTECETIYVVTHASPDGDAIGSSLALYSWLKEKYPNKIIELHIERVPDNFSFLPKFNEIVKDKLAETIETNPPELMIFTDMNMWHLLSRDNFETIKKTCKARDIKIVIMDHHPKGTQNIDATLSFSDTVPSASEIVYSVLKGLGAPIDSELADQLLTGIVLDTARFKYGDKKLTYTLTASADLLTHSNLSIQDITQLTTTNTLDFPKIASVLISNIQIKDNIAFTFISPEDSTQFPKPSVSSAIRFILSEVLLTFEGVNKGFLVYPGRDSDSFLVSLRSLGEEFPIDSYAVKLGGGGHLSSAAAMVKGNTPEEVIEKVLAVIQEED